MIKFYIVIFCFFLSFACPETKGETNASNRSVEAYYRQPQEPYRHEIENLKLYLRIDGDTQFLCISGKYHKNGRVVRKISIVERNKAEGMLTFELEKGEREDFSFCLPMPDVSAITWNGKIVCCGRARI